MGYTYSYMPRTLNMMYVIFLLLSFTNQIISMDNEYQHTKIITSYQSLKAQAQQLRNVDDTTLSTYIITPGALPECVLNIYLNNDTTITQDMQMKFFNLTEEERRALTLNLLKCEIKKNSLESVDPLQNINQHLCKKFTQSIDKLTKNITEQRQRLTNWHYCNTSLFILFVILLTASTILTHASTGCT